MKYVVDGESLTAIADALRVAMDYSNPITFNGMRSFVETIGIRCKRAETLYDQYKKLCDERSDEIDRLKSSNTRLAERIEMYIATIAELTTQNSSLTEQNSSLTEQNTALFNELTEANDQVDTLEDQNAELTERVDELTELNTGLETDYDYLEAENDTLREKNNELTERVTELETENAELTARIEELESGSGGGGGDADDQTALAGAYTADGTFSNRVYTWDEMVANFENGTEPSYGVDECDGILLSAAGYDVIVPDTVTNAGWIVCKNVVLPETTTRVGYTDNLEFENIYIKATSPPELESGAFDDLVYGSTPEQLAKFFIVAPIGCGDDYKSETGWCDYAERIKEGKMPI